MKKKGIIAIIVAIGLLAASASADLLFNDGLVLEGASRSVQAFAADPLGSEHIVYKTDTGSKYHSAFCRYLKDSCIKTTIEEAEAQGLEPCSRCTP